MESLYSNLWAPFFRAKKKQIKFLEIGVDHGGSLQVWRRYFGDSAIIFGIDINPECIKYDNLFAQVRIGSQTDEVFLKKVIKEMGGIDIILDDGSHSMRDIRLSLEYLFPHLNYGGIYVIEDLHTSYWKTFGGGMNSKYNFYNFVRDLVDDMHHWYHGKPVKHHNISGDLSAINIYDSITVLNKNKTYKPAHSEIVKLILKKYFL